MGKGWATLDFDGIGAIGREGCIMRGDVHPGILPRAIVAGHAGPGQLAPNLTSADVRPVLQVVRRVVMQVDVAVRDVARLRIAARVLCLYVILDVAGGVDVVARDEHEVISANGLRGAIPEVKGAGMYRERPARDRMTLVDATVIG